MSQVKWKIIVVTFCFRRLKRYQYGSFLKENYDLIYLLSSQNNI